MVTRRRFLEQIRNIFLTVGVAEGLYPVSQDTLAVPILNQYYEALAQNTNRKLALLVGINQYSKTSSLSGCLTDVELQKELLIHRFKFKSEDVLTLTDQQASCNNIKTAFVEHLVKQCHSGDVVVFHFSGYGRQVKIPDTQEIKNALVPVDGIISGQEMNYTNALLEETLFLLVRSLPTDQVTTILDTSYINYGASIQGNLRVRSCPNQPSQLNRGNDLLLQEQLNSNLTMSQLNLNQVPGILLTASQPTKIAAETRWSGFSAGLFTYALTQYLWQVTPTMTVQTSLNKVASQVEQLVGKEQIPRLEAKDDQSNFAYYLLSSDRGADGVVIAVEDDGKTAQLWLAGILPIILEYYSVNSILSLINSGVPIDLQVKSREGLTAKVKVISNQVESPKIEVGQLVQEKVRVIPKNLILKIALDSHLQRIERVDAISAFSNVSNITTLVNPGESADYIFGKALIDQDYNGGYGLFSLGYEPIPNTIGEIGEAVKVAVNRIIPKLKNLLATKLWRLTQNEGTSLLKVRAILQVALKSNDPKKVPQITSIIEQETLRPNLELSSNKTINKTEPSLTSVGFVKIAIGTKIQYQIQNPNNYPLYIMLVGFESNGSCFALNPILSSSNIEGTGLAPKDIVIPPNETLTIPDSIGEWVIYGPIGLAQTYIIASRNPFNHALSVLNSQGAKGNRLRVSELLNPWEVAKAILQDLHEGSGSKSTDPDYLLALDSWATLSFIYQVQ